MLSNMSISNSTDSGTMEALADLSDDFQADSLMPWDISDPFFSARTRILMQRALKCYVRQIIVFVGIPGNLLCCVVFFKQGLQDRIHLLLFSLAMADLTNLVAQLFLMPGCYLRDPRQVGNWGLVANNKVGYITWWSSYVSGALMVVVSLDRCLCVCLPLRVHAMMKYRSMVAAVVLSYMVPLIFYLPCMLALTIRWKLEPSTNLSIVYTEETSWFPISSRLAVDILNYFILITRPVYLATMIICCGITVVKLRHASRKREQMTDNFKERESTDRRITKMLLLLCLVYIIFLLHDVCSAVMVRIVPEYYVYRKYHNTYIVVVQFLWIASCLNSAVNFFVYLVLSSRFQRTLKDLCSCFAEKIVRRQPPWQVSGEGNVFVTPVK